MARRRRIQRRRGIPNIGYGKTIASVLGGALTTIVAFIVQQMGHPLPVEVSGAVQTVVTTLAVFFTHHTLTVKG